MKFLIHTYGCQMNVRESEAVSAMLVAGGHTLVATEAEADLVIINSCTVRQKAEEKAIGKAGNLIAEKKIVGLMGCAVKRLGSDVFKKLPKLDFAVGPRAFGLIPRIVDAVSHRTSPVDAVSHRTSPVDAVSHRTSPVDAVSHRVTMDRKNVLSDAERLRVYGEDANGFRVYGGRQILELGDDLIPTGLDQHLTLLSPPPPPPPPPPSPPPPPVLSTSVSTFQAYVIILVGCDNRCSYCIVPDVRGHEYSRPAREVVAEVRALAARGVKEVCLLGQSVLRYGVRNKAWDETDAPSPGGYTEPFPRLLEAVASVPGIERIRFTSAHPKGCTDELVRAYREFPQLCRHLHLPVQSGSDRILAEMGRRYTRAEYLAAVRKLRALDPTFAVTTDVIVGYPGETEEDFQATRSLMEEAGFDNSFVFKYSPRPGTRSALLADDVPTAEKERRDQVLLADQEIRGQRRNESLVGSTVRVLVEGPSKRNKARLAGRDGGNRIVVWENPAGAPVPSAGSFVDLTVTEAHPQTLIAKPLM